jgi:hypothetical protein
MITIDTPIEHESHEEKLKRLSITGYPEIFVKLEDAEEEDVKKYSVVKSKESLVKTVLQDPNSYFIKDPNGIQINFDTPAFFLEDDFILLEPEQAKLSEVFIREKKNNLNLTEFFLSNEDFKFNQFAISYYLDNISTRIFKPLNFTRFPHDYLTAKYSTHKKKINIIKNEETKPLDFTLGLIKLSGVKISPKLESWFIGNYPSLYVSGKVQSFNSNLEFLRWKNSENTKLLERITWHDIMRWILCEVFYPDGLNNKFIFPDDSNDYYYMNLEKIMLDKKALIRKKNVIINKFLTKPCSHLSNPKLSELHLENNFYICPHGNKVLCAHIILMNDRVNYDKHFNEFALELIDRTTICKICGAILLSNPDYINLKSNFSFFDDVKKYVFSKTLIIISSIEFSETVSPEFVNKFAGSIVEIIDSSIRDHFNDSDRLKGLSTEVQSTLKEIITVIHIHCALLILIQKHPDFIFYRGGKNNDFVNVKRIMINHLMNILSIQLNKIKVFKPMNLDNAFTIILEKISDNPAHIPKELHKHNPKETILYRYFSREYFYPFAALTDTNDDSLSKLFKDFYLQPSSIGKAIKFNNEVKIVESTEFLEWQKRLKTFHERDFRYLLGKAILRYSEPKLEHYCVLKYDNSYIGHIFGIKEGFHRHIWSSYLKEKKIIPISQINLENIAEVIVCSICGEEPKPENNLVEEINKNLILSSKINYFKNYCPIKFKHELVSGVCKHCKFGTDEFFIKNSLPSKKKILNPLKQEDIKFYVSLSSKINKDEVDRDPKYIGNLTKEQYKNFWKTFCQYEDVTYKNLLAGKTGNKKLALPKLLLQFNSFIIFLGRIKNLRNFPIKAFEPLYNEIINSVDEILNKMIQFKEDCSQIYIFEDPEGYYNYLKKKYVYFFNLLPPKTQEFLGKELLKLTEKCAMSEDAVKAAALINYKTKILDETIESSVEKNDFNYEGMDYDGHNEEMG